MSDESNRQKPSGEPSTMGLLGALANVEEIESARRLPGIVVGLILALPIFLVIAIVLAVVAAGLITIVGTTAPIARVIPLAWFGGSLLLTALAVRPLLRRLNGVLARRNLPTLY